MRKFVETRTARWSLVGLLLLVPAGPSAQIFVKWDAAGAKNGSSWADAYTDLQYALSVAAAGEKIWVAAGTYVPTTTTDRHATFQLVDSVAVYGGFAGTETEVEQRDITANKTTLSGEIGAPGASDNSYHVVKAGANHTGLLDGFTITAGNATGLALWGGGIDNGGGDVTYANLVIEGNHAHGGGGMYNHGEPTITNVSFINNTAVYYGGGLDNSLAGDPVLVDCTFSGNSAGDYGGAISSYAEGIFISGCDFSNNTAATDGGAILGEEMQIINCTFDHNQALGGDGGGVHVEGGSTTIQGVTFTGNTAYQIGGGISSYQVGALYVYDALFDGNSGNLRGGLRNCNTSPQLTNVILWENSAGFSGDEIGNFTGSNPDISYSLIRNSGGSGAAWDTTLGTDGGNNLDADPMYADKLNGDLRLISGSPAVNAGNNGAPYIRPADIDGNPRVMGAAVDMGAYEFDPATAVSTGGLTGLRLIRAVFPNPFNPYVVITLETASEMLVNVTVHDVRGKLVRTLFSAARPPGLFRLLWDGTDSAGKRAASGVYFVSVRSEGSLETRKVTLLK